MAKLRWLLLLQLCLLFDYEVLVVTSSSSPHVDHLCSRAQKTALLQFKHLFFVNDYATGGTYRASSRPKTLSWIEEVTGGDCCSWEGVKCDVSNGHVIELDVSSSELYGTIPFDSTLFQLSHLRKLNLAYNDFKGSSVWSAFGHNFPHLTHLNLSLSNFSGSIPSEISHLKQLVSLDFSSQNWDLRLKPQDFTMLIENQTQLQQLSLYGVNISSTLPESMVNVSTLRYIDLGNTRLYGELPLGIFHLPNLQVLRLSGNDGLTGNLPKSKWNSSSALQLLDLAGVRFSSELPDSIGGLESLRFLDLSKCRFFGSIPSSFGNLTQVEKVDLSSNSFTGRIPLTLSNLNHLEALHLSENNLQGEIPNAFAQLTELTDLRLGGNNLEGKFPHWLTNLTDLEYLDLSSNKLTGLIPFNTSEFQKLRVLSLKNNSISGTLPYGFFALPGHKNSTLKRINLSNNDLHGSLPGSISHHTRLGGVDLSNNNLSGTLEQLLNANLVELNYLDLSHNSFQGRLPPHLPRSMSGLLISHNKLVGDIPSSICSSSSLEVLDLSHNNLSGVIPKCISNSSSALSILNLGMNRFHGTIPLNFNAGNQLTYINFNGNHLEGQVPRSLTNCRLLQVLDLGSNKLNDTFPSWLQFLPMLQVLVLRHNKFHGSLGLNSTTDKVFPFPELRIFDLSHNEFVGPLPSNYLLSLSAMRNANQIQADTLQYMGDGTYNYAIVITLKGVVFEIQHILRVFTTIDFSYNEFEGEIPHDIGSLIGIHSLNFSSNVLTGHIPPSLANLTQLESLDLSSNQLSGVIPQELTRITTLAILNLSSNHLTGQIPRGFQFDTFQSDSYSGNLGLCGPPLSKKCNDQPSASGSQKDEDLFDGFGWKAVVLGYGCGIAFGLGVGFFIFSTGRPKRLVKFVEEKLLSMTKRPRKRRAHVYRNTPRRD